MVTKFNWTSFEDQALISLVNEQGNKKWNKIAKFLQSQIPDSNKSGKQCRERWHNHLDPDLDKASFTIADEAKIFELQKVYGNKWSLIAKHFPGRNDNFIKNCFYSAVRRKLRKYNRGKKVNLQLKGTVSSLLKNAETRKILLAFPEHQDMSQVKNDRIDSIKNLDKKAGLKIIVPEKSNKQYLDKDNLEDVSHLYTSMNLGMIEDDQDFPCLSNILSEINTIDDMKLETPSGFQIALPDYSLQSNFEYNITPRSSLI